jgi:hypothetical protein
LNAISPLRGGIIAREFATKPRMMPIKNLAKNGPVGVLKPRCIMAADHIRALTTPHRIKPTLTSRHSAWRPNPGRRSTYRRGESVQTTGTSSLSIMSIRSAGIKLDTAPRQCGYTEAVGSINNWPTGRFLCERCAP